MVDHFCHSGWERPPDYLAALFFGGGSSTSLPSDPTIVTFPLPVPIGGRSEITLASWQWMLGLAVLIPGLVIGAGLTLGIIYIILAPRYQRHVQYGLSEECCSPGKERIRKDL